MSSNIQFIISAVDDFSRQFDTLEQKMRGITDVTTTVGKGMVAIGTAGSAGLGYAVKTAADFEQGMSRVGALSGATNAELELLTQTAKELGATTSFSAREASEGMTYLAMAGYETNDIVAAMPGLLNAAAAGQTDLATTSDIVSNVLSGFGMEAAKTADVADILTKTFTSANVDLTMLGETMKYVAPVASAAGQEIEMMAAATGILGNAGIQGSQAGTALRAIIQRLADPVGKASDLMEELGITTQDVNGNMLPLTDILRQVTEATDGMGEAQRLAAVKTLVGEEAASSFLALMDAGADELAAFTEELINAGGTAEQVANAQLDNFSGQLTLIKSALEAVAISIGDALLPALKVVASGLQWALDMFNGLSEGTKSVIAITLAIASAFLLVGGSALLMVSPIMRLIQTFSEIAGVLKMTSAALLGKIAIIGAVIAAIIAIGIAVYMAYQRFEWFRNVVDTVWDAIKTAFTVAVEFIKSALQTGLDFLAQTWDTHKDTVMNVVNAVWETIQTVFNAIRDYILDVWGRIQTFWVENGQQILDAATNVWNVISTVIQTAMTVIITVITTAWNAITSVISAVMPVITEILRVGWEIVKILVIQTWEAIKNVIDGAINVIMGIIKFFAALFTGDLRGMWEAVKQIFTGAIQFIWGLINLYFIGRIVRAGAALFASLRGIVSAGWAAIRNFFSTALNAIRNHVSSGFNAVRNVINTVMNAVRGVVSSIWNAMRSTFTSNVNRARSIVTTGFNAIRNVIRTVMNVIRTIVRTVWNAIRSAIQTVINAIRNVVTNGFNAVRNAIRTATTAARTAVSTAFRAMVNIVRTLTNNIRTTIQSGWNRAVSFLRSINLFSIGRNIIQGLIRGISSMIGAVGAKIKEVGSSIKNGIKNVLGIASPAKEMIDVGQWTGEGLVVGLDNMLADVRKQADQMAMAAYITPQIGEVPSVDRIETSQRGQTRSTGESGAGNGGNEYFFEVPVVIDGREVARATAKFTEAELERMKRNRQRVRGVTQ